MAQKSQKMNGRSSQSKTTPEQRIAAWRRFAYKFLIILQYLNTKARVALVLGKETFERAFLSAKKTIENKKGEQKEINRVIKGEVVGKELPTKGEGVPKMDPAMCPRPESEMVRKSNARKDGKGLVWWTCAQCKTRWERFTLEDAARNKEPKDNDVVTFGKHQGRTYLDIRENFPDYSNWVMMTYETENFAAGVGLAHLAKYLQLKIEKEAAEVAADQNFPETDDEMMYPEEWLDTEADDPLL